MGYTYKRYDLEEIEDAPPRILYNMALSGHIGPDNALYVPMERVYLPVSMALSPIQRVLENDELVSAIGAALVNTYTTIHSYYPPGTTKQMLDFSLTCRAWFDTGMRWVWWNFEDLTFLVNMLMPASDGHHIGLTLPSAQYRYLRAAYITNPNGLLQPEYLKFRYYAGLIRTLSLQSDHCYSLFLYGLFLKRPHLSLFPNLQSISWVAKYPNLSSTTLRTLFAVCRSSRVTEFTLAIGATPPYPFGSFGVGILRTLNYVSEAAPGIKSLTVIGHHDVVIPATCLSLFPNLVYVNLQIGVHAQALQLELEFSDAEHLPSIQTVLILWSPQTNLSFLAHTFQLSHLCCLTITADDHPPLLLNQIPSMVEGSGPFPLLIGLSISCTMQLPHINDGIDFGMLIKPFLPSTSMENVCIQFPGFRLAFSMKDLENMIKAWPSLRSLDISFVPSIMYPAPDLRYVIECTYEFCPHLHSVHVPALATYLDSSQHFTLNPSHLHPHFRFSSDVFSFQHHPLAIALEIFRVFPTYMPILPFFMVGTHWSIIEAYIQGLQEGRIGLLESFQFHNRSFRWAELHTYCHPWLFSRTVMGLGGRRVLS